MQIVYNAIRTPDGTVLESNRVHDCIRYMDTVDGDTYMVDGGKEYLRRSGENYTELSLYEDAPHSAVRKVLTWGTYGVEGDKPLKWVVLKDMETDHIKAVLDNCSSIAQWRRDIFNTELEYRYD